MEGMIYKTVLSCVFTVVTGASVLVFLWEEPYAIFLHCHI